MRVVKIVRILILALAGVSLIAFLAVAATNTVSPSIAGQRDSAITANALKPDVCAGITLSGTVNVADNGNNLLLGTAGNDNLSGLGGNDCILGGNGWDTLYGNDGNDVLVGGGQLLDFLYGGNGIDTCTGALFRFECEN